MGHILNFGDLQVFLSFCWPFFFFFCSLYSVTAGKFIFKRLQSGWTVKITALSEWVWSHSAGVLPFFIIYLYIYMCLMLAPFQTISQCGSPSEELQFTWRAERRFSSVLFDFWGETSCSHCQDGWLNTIVAFFFLFSLVFFADKFRSVIQWRHFIPLNWVWLIWIFWCR